MRGEARSMPGEKGRQRAACPPLTLPSGCPPAPESWSNRPACWPSGCRNWPTWRCRPPTVGVRANQQGKGYGHALMAALIQRAYQLGSRWLTLEVRPSNDVAVRLYEKFGFKVIGRRRGYYTDNNEDAIVMWSDSIQASSF